MSKHALSAKQWIVVFVALCFLIVFAYAAFNYIVDPFGAFGDKVFKWWSYDETINPRVAKISYLEQHHEEYDSYVIGCSSTSSFPKKQLDKYYDASFYNLIMYGADMLDVEQIAEFLISNYEVKNLMLNVYIDNGIIYDEEPDPLTYGMHYKATKSSALDYYKKYLFANVNYGLEKLCSLKKDTYLQQVFDVFNEKSGAYDKSKRDAEPIGDLDQYYEAYPCFVDYKFWPSGQITKTKETVESVARIKSLCEKNGVNLIVVAGPVYADYYKFFNRADVNDFYTSLAEVTDFWDFTYSSVSFEPRYYYDETHFRNCVGEMALARIAGDESVYIPSDFGVYVNKENAKEHFEKLNPVPLSFDDYVCEVPILMYHNLAEKGDGGDTISVTAFEDQMKALKNAGYTAIDLDDLRAYVYSTASLPQKCVVITFDDGYQSNFDLAMPILKKYDLKATVFVIGSSIGKNVYKDGLPMNPHFDLRTAKSMKSSGVFDIQSHGFDLHQVACRDEDPVREGIIRFDDESESEYIETINNDCAAEHKAFEAASLPQPFAFAYPYGKTTLLGRMILQENGIELTLTTNTGFATLIKGLPQSLLDLNRFMITDSVSGSELVQLITPAK